MNLKQKLELFANIDIYPVISSEFCKGKDSVEVLKEIADGGARIVQLREKNLPITEIAKLAEQFRKITSE